MNGLLYCNTEHALLVLGHYSPRLHENFVDCLKKATGKETVFLETDNE